MNVDTKVTKHLIVVLFFALLLNGCTNNAKNDFQEKPNLDNDVIVRGEILYSKSGKIKARILGDTILKNSNSGLLIFPSGITVESFDDSNNIEARLTADSAVYNEMSNESFFYRNVFVVNLLNKDSLWAEDLTVKISLDSIFTLNPVHIVTPRQNIYGSGFYSNLNFSKIEITNSTGKVSIPSF